MTALLTIDKVCKRYGDHTALDAVQLEIRQGEFIALLGPSGCGKTTLLRSMAGLLQPDSGRIVIDGLDVSNLPPYRRPINTVFQNYALFPHMSVLENVCYGPRRQGASRLEAGTRAIAALELVGLAALAARYPREMSGGQQQRVALARAIVNQPKLLLLDEPLSALDMKLRKRMQLELKHLQIKLGIAFVFVTHDQEEAMTMADRIVVMNAGRIEQIGAGTDIYRAPASRFVAEFIGEANLFDYELSGSHQIRLTLPELTIDATQAQLARRGVAVLRPEQIQVLDASTAASGALCRLSGVLKDVVSVGSHTSIHVDLGGHQISARTIGLPKPGMTPGSTVLLGFDPAHLHFIGDRA